MNRLDKRWKELLFAANSFGPNLLFTLLGAHLTDNIRTRWGRRRPMFLLSFLPQIERLLQK